MGTRGSGPGGAGGGRPCGCGQEPRCLWGSVHPPPPAWGRDQSGCCGLCRSGLRDAAGTPASQRSLPCGRPGLNQGVLFTVPWTPVARPPRAAHSVAGPPPARSAGKARWTVTAEGAPGDTPWCCHTQGLQDRTAGWEPPSCGAGVPAEPLPLAPVLPDLRVRPERGVCVCAQPWDVLSPSSGVCLHSSSLRDPRGGENGGTRGCAGATDQEPRRKHCPCPCQRCPRQLHDGWAHVTDGRWGRIPEGAAHATVGSSNTLIEWTKVCRTDGRREAAPRSHAGNPGEDNHLPKPTEARLLSSSRT